MTLKQELIDIIKDTPEYWEIITKAFNKLSYEELRTYVPLSHQQQVREAQLRHRIKVIRDDLNELTNYLNMLGLHKELNREIDGISGWSYIGNIDAACDLSSDECYDWKPYSSNK
jgi:hypothetical protein